MALLEVSGLQVNYGLIKAIRGVDFHVDAGEIVALIGANGAGKTTIMHALSGLIPKAAGRVLFDGEDITATPAHKLVPLGMAQVPEGRRIFQELTVAENLTLGAYTRRDRAENAATLEDIFTHFPILKERQKQVAGTLSGGEQQMLTMARGLMMEPKLMLLDEPSMGLAPVIVEQIFEIIADLHRRGITILLVEQNAHMALEIAQRGYVIQTGRIALTDASERLQNDPVVQGLYLGEA